MMLTKSGKNVSLYREKIVIEFLFNLFEEENTLEWKTYLIDYIKDNN